MNLSLEPISENPLGRLNARHLLNRCLFAPTRSEITEFAEFTIGDALERLLDPGLQPGPPLQVFGTDPNIAFGETWVDAAPDSSVRGSRKKSLRAWWIGVSMNQEASLREKMVLFWHNHFVTEVNVVGIPAYVYDYVDLIRQNAMGNFKNLAAAMTVNTAMLRYLDGVQNTAASPNENYSRELFELFTIGKGPLAEEGDYTFYTEQDVQEGARVLTGWKVNNTTLSSWFNASKHDMGEKTFSAYYGNRSIPNLGDQEYLALIDMIFEKKETARALVRKLYRWFIYYHIDADIEEQIIEPLAEILYQTGYDIQPVLLKLLSSQHFFDDGFRGSYIKNPLEFILGSLRRMEVSVPDDLAIQYEFWNLFYLLATFQEQSLGTPPDVAGWPAYYIEPSFNEVWVNSASLPQKAEFTTKLIHGRYKKMATNLVVDVIALAEQTSQPSDPDTLISEFVELMLPVELSEDQLNQLKEILIPGLPDFEWTAEWNKYKADPGNASLKAAVENALRLLLEEIMHLPEYYLM